MTLRSSWIDSSLELAMATIRAMEVPSPGSWGCRRIASRRASPPRVDPGVTAIQIVSSHPRLSTRLRLTARAGPGENPGFRHLLVYDSEQKFIFPAAKIAKVLASCDSAVGHCLPVNPDICQSPQSTVSS